MIKTTIRKSNTPYYDDLNFPRGFSRSGEFTIAESTLLNDYGHTLKSLHDGVQMPDNEEEKRFVAVVNGIEEAVSNLEKTWTKYLKSVAPKTWHILNGSNKPQSSNDSSEYELEL